MMYGIRIRQKRDGHEMQYWFDDLKSRDEFVKRFSKANFEIVEYISEQMELPFDIRIE